MKNTKRLPREPEEYGSVMTKAEVEEFLQLSRNTVTRLIQTGELKGHRFGEQYRFLKKDILAFFEGGASHDAVAM